MDGQIPAVPREIDRIPGTNGKVELLGDRRDFCVDDSGSFYNINNIYIYGLYIWIIYMDCMIIYVGVYINYQYYCFY